MTQELRARAELPGRSRVGANGEAPPMLDPRRWLALTVVLVAGFMDLLDVTIVNLAVPTILRDLQAAYAQNLPGPSASPFGMRSGSCWSCSLACCRFPAGCGPAIWTPSCRRSRTTTFVASQGSETMTVL
jgi:hypothetical protein